MGKVFDEIDDKLAAWIGRRRMFFVATAPSGVDGHVNVSPKGPIERLRTLGPRRIAYVDLVGSGAETVAHVRDNGRIAIMLCAFEGPRASSACMVAEMSFTSVKCGAPVRSIGQPSPSTIILLNCPRVALLFGLK